MLHPMASLFADPLDSEFADHVLQFAHNETRKKAPAGARARPKR